MRRLAVSVAILLATVGNAAAACPSTTTDLALALSRADSAFVSMDIDAFTTARDDARVLLGCLSVTVTPADAAAYHRMEALDGYIAQDEARALAGFRSAVAVQPSWRLPTDIAPPGNPLHDLYQKAREAPASLNEGVDLPSDHALYVDGVRSTTRPTERPIVAQVVDNEGVVLWTGWLRAGEKLAKVKGSGTVGEHAPAECGGARVSVSLLASAAGVAAVSGGLYALAISSRTAFDDPTTPRHDLDGLRKRANTAVFASGGAAAVSAGLAVAVFVTVKW